MRLSSRELRDAPRMATLTVWWNRRHALESPSSWAPWASGETPPAVALHDLLDGGAYGCWFEVAGSTEGTDKVKTVAAN